MWSPTPQGRMFRARAVAYSGWKLNGAPAQVNGLVFMNPFLAEAIMKPLRPVVRSVSFASSAYPPGIVASHRWTVILSPGFISRVCAFGVNVARSDLCGFGGPVGTPPVWMKAKLTVSGQWGLQVKLAWHSRLSMFSAEHQWALSQPMLSASGAMPGG